MIASVRPDSATTAEIVAALIRQRGGAETGGDRTSFRCLMCGGEAVYSGREARWRCQAGCGANGDWHELTAYLGVADAILRPTAATGIVYPSTISAAELVGKTFPDPRWAIPGTVPEGAALLAGAPKKGKSWMLLGWSVAIAAGGVALGILPVAAGDVLYLALEDTERRLQERLRLVLGGESAPDRLHFRTAWPSLGDGAVGMLDAWLTAHPAARLVGIDVLARLRGPIAPGANLYQSDYGTMAALKTVADAHGVALVGVHHTRKADADDPLDLVSGTTGLAGAADTILILKRDKGRADATLYVRGRDVPEADHALAFDPVTCTWSLLGDAAEFRLTEERSEIVALLRESPEPLAPKQIAEALGRKDGAVRVMLGRMAAAGEVETVGRGKYRLPPVTSVTPVTMEISVTAVTSPLAPSIVTAAPYGCNGRGPDSTPKQAPSLQALPKLHPPVTCLDCGGPLPAGRSYRCTDCEPGTAS